MSGDRRSSRRKSHVVTERPPFERIALLLQGGGALGSYQAGVYQALAEANLHPDWVAGISIGAINSALVAGNSPEKRVERLREFWEAITTPPFGLPDLNWFELKGEFAQSLVNQASSLGALLSGAPNFFKLRVPAPYFQPNGTLEAISYYDIAPLKGTLERLVDFDLINAGATRLSVGAVNVRTGNFVYFDSTTHQICPEHVIASGSLRPDSRPPRLKASTLGTGVWFPIRRCNGCWTAALGRTRSPFRSICGVRAASFRAICSKPRRGRRKSAARAAPGWRPTSSRKKQLLRRSTAKLLAKMPPHLLQTPEAEILAAEADEKVYNLIQLIYRAKHYEGNAKDYEFSRRTMEEHWRSGYNDAVRTLRHPEVLQRPNGSDGVFTFDLAYDGRE